MTTTTSPGLTFYDVGGAHRYRLDGKRVPNVTTIINGGLPKPALVTWAARTVAERAADQPSLSDAIRQTSRAALVAFLSGAPDEARKSAGDRGTLVHDYASRIAAGEVVTPPDDVVEYVESYVRWLDANDVRIVLSERPVASRAHFYAGRFDLIGELNGERWLLDIKTGGVYGDASLQLAAYAGADFYVDENGVELPVPIVDKIGVVHVQPDGTDLYSMGDIDAGWSDFVAARRIYDGASRRRNLDGYNASPVIP